jgi:hypothetical protein
MKKAVFYILFLSFCVTNMQNASAIMIDIVPTSQTVQAGDAFDVNVVVSGLSATNEIVSAYDFDISYDSSVLAATTVSFGQYLNLSNMLDSFQDVILTNPGIIDFAEVSLLFNNELAAQQPDSFLLASLSFKAIGAGISKLLFVPDPVFGIDVKGSDPLLPLTVDVTGAQVAVNPAVSVPEPSTLLLMLIALIALPLIKNICVTERAL